MPPQSFLRFGLLAVSALAAYAVAATPAGAEQPLSAPRFVEAPGAMISVAEEVQVSASAAGVLRKLHAREGTLLQRGEKLLAVDDRKAQIALSQAEVELKRAKDEATSDVKGRHAKKSRELATSEYQRALAIDKASPSSVSDREIERLKLAADVADLDVERAEHEEQLAEYEHQLQQQTYRLAQQEISEHQVAAPITGLVVEVLKRPGEWVDRGEPVVTLVRVDRLRAEAVLPAATASLDLVGSPAVFRTQLAGGERVDARGEVVFVSPKADPVSARARVWMEFPVTDRRLRPGLRGVIRIEANAKQEPSSEAAQPVSLEEQSNG